jgi:Tfp pilus assembly protein PilO
MNIKLGNMKLSIALIMTIAVQAAGLIWYVASLDSQMNVNSAQIQELKEAHNLKIDDLEIRLAESEKVQRVIDNEMRTIMSDHSSFTDILKELNKAGLLPSGEKREYGGYY